MIRCRAFLFTIISLIVLGSCNRYVENKARENEILSQLNGFIGFFSQCHYRLPKSIDEIYDFSRFCEKSEFNCWQSKDFAYLRGLEKLSNLSSFHKDSLFLYNMRSGRGCVVYGHPIYWHKHYEDYPEDRWTYTDIFRLSALDDKGKYVFVQQRHKEFYIGELEGNEEIKSKFNVLDIDSRRIDPEYLRIIKIDLPSKECSIISSVGDFKHSQEEWQTIFEHFLAVSNKYFRDYDGITTIILPVYFENDSSRRI